jgi:hypothetical protein
MGIGKTNAADGSTGMTEAMTENALVPKRQKDVIFYGDHIVAVQLENGDVYVPVRQMCELLGVGYQGQIDRIRRDPVLQKYEQPIVVSREGEGRSGGAQETNCLLLKYVPGWLFGIQASRVREEVRERLLHYQEEVYDVIWQAFRDEVEIAPPPDHMTAPLDDLAMIEQLGLAIYRLARQQRAMEARLDTVEDAVWTVDERTRAELDSLRKQLGSLELRLAPAERSRHISEQQAVELSQAVKLVAMALGKQSGRNEFGAVYSELYRRFGITSYRNLPTHAFQSAMEWLADWFRSVDEESSQ